MDLKRHLTYDLDLHFVSDFDLFSKFYLVYSFLLSYTILDY